MLILKLPVALCCAVPLVLMVMAVPGPAAESAPGKGAYPPPVQAASDEAESAIKRFRIPKGLKVELAAAEPHLANPVCFTIDEQGRFY
ncbi:MAG: quinoprotein glucose dehydrogenase, partial [Verrucomicrobiota bacterium]